MTLKKVFFMFFMVGLLLIGSALEAYDVTYRAYVAEQAWLSWVSDGQIAGTTGQSRRIEAIEISLSSTLSPMSVEYRGYVEDVGWQPWVSSGQTAGTTGQHKRMEAIQIRLVNPAAGYTIKYRAHCESSGWQPWVSNGQTAGTTGLSRRMEAIQIILYPSCGVQSYAPTYWNDGGVIQSNNNCYNYANNKRTDTYAQPGRRGGALPSSLTCSTVSTGAIADGLEATTASAPPPTGKTKIALVIWPGTDYHWYRLDNNGYWSHKPGGTQATNLDNSGNVITNPATANRGPYTTFCGYFLTCSDTSQGQGHAAIQ